VTVWRLAWRAALARRRLLAWNVAVPVILLAPVALSPAAAQHRTAVFGVFFVFFGTFGSAIPAVRDAESGWLDTVFRTGVSRGRWLAETVAAGAALDLLELLPATAVLLLSAGRTGPDGLAGLAAALVLAILVANGLGVLLAALVRSHAEAALVSAALSLLLLHFAGFFRIPVAGWTLVAATVMPYRPLREALATVQTGGPATWGSWAPAVATGLVACLLLVALAPRWTRRFEWPQAGNGAF